VVTTPDRVKRHARRCDEKRAVNQPRIIGFEVRLSGPLAFRTDKLKEPNRTRHQQVMLAHFVARRAFLPREQFSAF